MENLRIDAMFSRSWIVKTLIMIFLHFFTWKHDLSNDQRKENYRRLRAIKERIKASWERLNLSPKTTVYFANYITRSMSNYIWPFVPCEHVCKLLLANSYNNWQICFAQAQPSCIAIIQYKSIFKAWFEQQTHHHDYVCARRMNFKRAKKQKFTSITQISGWWSKVLFLISNFGNTKTEWEGNKSFGRLSYQQQLNHNHLILCK